MTITIYPSEVNGEILAPASKSVAQRAIAIASLAEGKSEILHPGQSDDVKAAIRVCRSFGAKIEELADRLIIQGGIKPPTEPLHCGEAGLSIRMFSAIAGIFNKKITLTGEGSLLTRPMDVIENSLKSLGIDCSTHQGLIPIEVCGPMPGGKAIIDGSMSSQVLTGILMAAPYAQKSVSLEVSNLKSRPYIDITTQVMKAFGVPCENQNYENFHIHAPQKYQATIYSVEGDWSGAAFMLVAGAIAGKVSIHQLRQDSTQADKAIMIALQRAGARISISENTVSIEKSELKAFELDATHCPDLFPPLVALAAHCRGTTKIEGVWRLKAKESDRGLTLQEEFKKLGIAINIEGDTMFIEGGRIQGASTHSRHDHRIAMACAVAALTSDAPVHIEESQAVDKSYPDFFKDLEKLTSKRNTL